MVKQTADSNVCGQDQSVVYAAMCSQLSRLDAIGSMEQYGMLHNVCKSMQFRNTNRHAVYIYIFTTILYNVIEPVISILLC